MSKRDYYEVLGVARDTGAKEIKSAYRKLALQYHPDRNPDDTEATARFKEAAEAYSVLSDPEKRRTYDRHGHGGLSNSGFDGFGGLDEIFASFGDIFGGMFGFERGRRGGGQRGAHLETEVELEFGDPIASVEKEIQVTRHVHCVHCKGTGARAGTALRTCRTCGGVGQVRTVSRSIFGQLMNVTSCPTCHGGGREILEACPECRGSGLTLEKSRLKVKVPAGVDDGLQLRLRGEGEPGSAGGPPGDLFINIRVRAHERFERQGTDVLLRVPVTFSQVALGDTLEVPTLEGSRELELATGTQSHSIFRIPGAGFPDMRTGRRGDQIVRVEVATPDRLTEEQEQLFQRLAEIGGSELRPPRKGIFEKIKDTISDLVE